MKFDWCTRLALNSASFSVVYLPVCRVRPDIQTIDLNLLAHLLHSFLSLSTAYNSLWHIHTFFKRFFSKNYLNSIEFSSV